MRTTKIEWTDKTWNPVTGCTKISAGCTNCYAEIMAKRLQAMGQSKYAHGFTLTTHESILQDPIQWKKPHSIFVCSMSDLFHNNVPFTFISKVMVTIRQTPWHNYQILTKRAQRMNEFFRFEKIPPNAWLGVTVESKANTNRIDFLRELDAPIKFLSCEPLIENLGSLNLSGIDWVIVGGESGNRARPMLAEWVNNVFLQCKEQEILFFFKQWGTWGEDGIKRNKKTNGKYLNGKIIQEIPQYA